MADDDALHAWAFAVDAYNLGGRLIMYIGPARTGALLKIGVVDWYDTAAIVHAMPVRSKFPR